jgi:antitoxin (DNA-binding transcriptional repressor) of toxin-antitoxin stability system
MSAISVSELKKTPARKWLKAAGQGGLVVTSKGRPVAMLVRIAVDSLDSTRSLLRRFRALRAQSTLQHAAEANGLAGLSLSDIDGEIAAARRVRRRK